MKRFAVLSNPRSGTSLLVHLVLTGFHSSELMPVQKGLDGSDIYEYRILMDKVFDNCLDDDTYFLFVLRDPRDVIVSVHPAAESKYGYTVDFENWINNFNEFLGVLAFCPTKVLVIRYEELVSDPDKVQNDLASFMNIVADVPFSECFGEFSNIKKNRVNDMSFEMGGVRKLTTSRIGRWKTQEHSNRIREQLDKSPEMHCILKVLNYE